MYSKFLKQEKHKIMYKENFTFRIKSKNLDKLLN